MQGNEADRQNPKLHRAVGDKYRKKPTRFGNKKVINY